MRYINAQLARRCRLVSGIVLLAVLLVNALSTGAALAQATSDEFSLSGLSASAGGVVSTNNPGKQQVGSATVSVSANNPNQEYQVDQSTISYTWSPGNLTYSATANGTFGPPPNGAAPSFTFSPNPTTAENATTSISVTTTAATVPGYWKFTVQVSVSFNTTNGGGNVTMPLASVPNVGPVTVVQLSLNGPTGVQIIGEGALFTSSILPTDVQISSSSWSYPSGTDVSGYFAADINSGHVGNPLMLTGTSPELKFYWVQPGQKNVTLSATISGLQIDVSQSFTVVTPYVEITSFTGTVGVDTRYAVAAYQLGYIQDPNGEWLHDGIPPTTNQDPDIPGIVFKVQVDDPSNFTGSPTWVQLFHNASFHVTTNQPRNYQSNEIPGLDQRYPYPWIPSQYGPNHDIYINSDSPGLPVDPSPIPPTLDTNRLAEADVSGTFDDWLMYQPNIVITPANPGTIPVPVQKLTWQWSGTANTTASSVDAWRLISSSNPNPGPGSSYFTFPDWDQTAAVGEWH